LQFFSNKKNKTIQRPPSIDMLVELIKALVGCQLVSLWQGLALCIKMEWSPTQLDLVFLFMMI